MQRKRVRTTATTASPITSQKMRMSRSSVGGEVGVSDVAMATTADDPSVMVAVIA